MPYESTVYTIIAVRKIQDNGRVQIPREVREALQIKDQDNVVWIKCVDGKYSLIKATKM